MLNIDDIIVKQGTINCPYLGKKPLTILCYYTIMQLYKSCIEPVPCVKHSRRVFIDVHRYKKYETCFNCRDFPGRIWKDKELMTAIQLVIKKNFRRSTTPRNRLVEAFRAMLYRAKIDPTILKERNQVACKKWRAKNKKDYNAYMKDYMSKKRHKDD